MPQLSSCQRYKIEALNGLKYGVSEISEKTGIYTATNIVYFDRPVTGWLLSDTGTPILQFNHADKASISELPAGVYFIRITETGQVFRIVKLEGASKGIRE